MPRIITGPPGDTFIVAGVLRALGVSPWFETLDDGTHVPIGGLTVTSVSTTAINISFDPCTYIHSFIVAPDDVLGGLGWSAGASVGLSTAVIKVGSPSGAVNPQTISNTSANFWVHALLSV